MYEYGYVNSAESIADATVANAGLLGLFGGIMIFSFILSLIIIISYAKIFKKAGKPWWASIVPIYNVIVMIKVAKLPLWYIVLFLVPIANIYAIFKIYIEIAKKFGKGTGFGIGMALVGIIFIPLLAFSDNEYEKSENVLTNTNNNEFDVNQVINNGNESNNNMNQYAENNVQTIENVQIEPVNMMNIPVEEPTLEPVVENIPTMENVQVEPSDMMNIPVEEPTLEPVFDNNIQNIEQPNAFNMAPTEMKDNNSVGKEVVLSDNVDDKKMCKNCGNELPEIVSICPNCGTDNE